MYQQPPGAPGWGPPQGYPPQGYGAPPPPPPKSTSKVLLAVLGIVGICGACMVVGALGKKNDGGGGGGGGSAAPSAQRQYVTQTCAEVAHLFGNQSRNSELQQDEMWRAYDDKWVRWQVRAGNISETLGTLQMQFKCSGESLILDGTAAFEDDQRARLLQIHEGDSVTIEGRLADHGRLLGLSLRDATIASQ